MGFGNLQTSNDGSIVVMEMMSNQNGNVAVILVSQYEAGIVIKKSEEMQGPFVIDLTL